MASLPCPYGALAELIGFCEQAALRALRRRPICSPSCRGPSQAQALAPHGTGTEVCSPAALPQGEASPEHAARHVLQPSQRRSPSGMAAASPLLRTPCASYSGSICTAVVPAFRADIGYTPSPQNILWKAPVKQFLRSSLPLRAGCNQTACARGQQAAERQSPALSSSSITMLLTTLYPGAADSLPRAMFISLLCFRSFCLIYLPPF